MQKVQELANKSKLTQEELDTFFENLRSVDAKLGHARDYKTMMNQVRRELLDFIGYEIKTLNELKVKLQMKEDLLLYHLSMLKQSFYVIESEEGWKNSPKGLGYLENAVVEE